MPRRNMNVFIHTYPFFDNVQLHLPGAEVTLKHEAAFTDTCMRWVEKPVIEPEPGIALRSVQGSISDCVQSTPAEPSRLGRDSSAKATTPVKRRYAKRKRTPVLKANVLTPVVVPVPATEEARTVIAAPKGVDVTVATSIAEEGTKPSSERPARSEATPSTEPPPLQESAPLPEPAPPAPQADASAGMASHGVAQLAPAPASVT
jgi:hypothetical protein